MRRFLAGLELAAIVTSVWWIVLSLAGEDPGAFILGAIGTRADLARTLDGATPLIFTGLAVAIPYRAGLFNIGAEGQLVTAGFVAGFVGAHFAYLPPALLLPLIVASSMAAGTLWGAVAGWLRARLAIHEVIATILLNFIAFSLVSFLLAEVGYQGMEPKTADVPPAVMLPRGWGPLLVAAAFALAADWLLFRTRFGLILRAFGGRPKAAEAAGAKGGRIILASFLIAGGLAALAGTTQVLGVHGSYVEGFSPGYGFTGIAVALLAGCRPAFVVLSALLFALLRSGAFAMDAMAGIPRESVGLLEVLVIVLVASEAIRKPRRRAGKEVTA
ncbi:MAG: ABC transporter permease [Planctomycetota bacterium]